MPSFFKGDVKVHCTVCFIGYRMNKVNLPLKLMSKKVQTTVVLREKELLLVSRVGASSSTNATGPTYLQFKDSMLPKSSPR